MPGSDWLATGKKFEATSKMTRKLNVVSHRVNALLKYGDPAHFDQAVELRRRLEATYAGYENLGRNDPLVYEGREILWNRMSGEHRDSQDPQKSYAILTTFGDFKGGLVYLPYLGVRLRLEPGDALALRGRVLPHTIEDWDEGQRISIPHFTHTSVWHTEGNYSVDVPKPLPRAGASSGASRRTASRRTALARRRR